jgi:hypothetical protein
MPEVIFKLNKDKQTHTTWHTTSIHN